jgi:hypothetical protein
MNKIKQLILAFALVTGIASTAFAGTASAINVFPGCGAGAQGGGSTSVFGAAGTYNASSMAKIIVNTMLFILGILAVIMIIVSGIKYVTSNGDASKIKSAKDTLTYSIVGLVVAILAYAIVNYVVTRF